MGKVSGRCPLGSTRPNSVSASAVPLSMPLYQFQTIVDAFGSHGIVTGEPATNTSTASGSMSSSASISASCSYGRSIVMRSRASRS